MKVMIACSTAFYDKIESIKQTLEQNNHQVITPNGYAEPGFDDDTNKMSGQEYSDFFKKCYYASKDKIDRADAILVLNYTKEKNGKTLENYIGASTFLEMYVAFMNNKKIYTINGYPDNMLTDEIKGFSPIILNGDINQIK